MENIMQVYLDNNATSMVSPNVRDAMMPFFGELYGNPSSMHSFGGNVARYVKEAREKVAAMFNVTPEEIVFTSCGSESDNHAIFGVIEAQPEKKHIVTTKVEHPAVRNVFKHLAKTRGYRVTELSVDKKGDLDLDEVKKSLTPDTALISVMSANNETGNIYPIGEIAAMAKENGIVCHTDAVQAAGKIPMDLQHIPVDLLSLSGHKIHAPKGIGVLFIRRGTRVSPFIIGGHQESGRRAGTENVPYIVGLGKAVEICMRDGNTNNTRMKQLRDYLIKEIETKIPGVKLNGHRNQRLNNNVNFSFQGVTGESIVAMLDTMGICASVGTASTSEVLSHSYVLQAMGVNDDYINGAVRFTLGRAITKEDLDYVVNCLINVVKKLRSLSPVNLRMEVLANV